MEQSLSWEANRSLATQEIPHIVCNRIHKRPPPVSILSQIYPVCTPRSNIWKVHFNIILILKLFFKDRLYYVENLCEFSFTLQTYTLTHTHVKF